jgi:hypothetical protein
MKVKIRSSGTPCMLLRRLSAYGWWYGGEEEVATLCRIRGKECKHGGSLEQKGQRESRGSREGRRARSHRGSHEQKGRRESQAEGMKGVARLELHYKVRREGGLKKES